MIFSAIPSVLGYSLRRLLYRYSLRKCGVKFRTAPRVKIQDPKNIEVGNNVRLNYGVWIASNPNKDASIKFGNDVLVGPYSIIHSGNHNYQDMDKTIWEQGYTFKPIVIEDDVWIAARCTILSGVRLGKGCVIAAGSVVTKDVAPYTVVGGVPAKVLSKRN